MQTCERARAAISALPPEFERWRLDFVTSVGIRIASYVFMRGWCEHLRENCGQLREIVFLAADIPAFAAVDAGLHARYIQHGLIRHSLVLPRFGWIDALTPDEASHFRQRLPSAEITLQPVAGPVNALDTTSSGILAASVYLAMAEMQRVSTLLDWASSILRDVWVRPHPREDRSFWNEEAKRSSVRIEDRDALFEAALSRLRPRLVVRGTPLRWRTRWRWESFP